DDARTGTLGGSFDIRYATFPFVTLNDYNIAASSSVVIATSTAAGTRQTALISGLIGTNTLYYAITSKDSLGVRSGLSNSATTLSNLVSLSGAGTGAYGVAWGDYSGDGILDLVVVRQGAQDSVLYRGNGNAPFLTTTILSGTGAGTVGMSGAWADYDEDGDLDIAIAN